MLQEVDFKNLANDVINNYVHFEDFGTMIAQVKFYCISHIVLQFGLQPCASF